MAAADDDDVEVPGHEANRLPAARPDGKPPHASGVERA
jgi:hypothetical protein